MKRRLRKKRISKTPLYVIHPDVSWETFQLLHEKLVLKDGGPVPEHMNEVLWRMLRERQVYLGFDPLEPGDMFISLQMPEGRPLIVLNSPPPKKQHD